MSKPIRGLKVNYVHRLEPLRGQVRAAIITDIAPDESCTLTADTEGGAHSLGKSLTTAGVRYSSEPKPHTWHHLS